MGDEKAAVPISMKASSAHRPGLAQFQQAGWSKQLQHFTLTFRVVDLKACGVVDVSDASRSRARFNVLESDSTTITRVCRSNSAAGTRCLECRPLC